MQVNQVQADVHVPLGGGAPLLAATFLTRPNRFLVEAQLGEQVVKAHLADRGRLHAILVPNAQLLLAHRPGPKRATAYQAVAAYVGAQLASIDTLLPNRLIEIALRSGALVPFRAYPLVRREVRVGASRFDFAVDGPDGRLLIEVKSAGLVVQGIARFPDAPTERGRRHLGELAELARAGQPTAVIFVAQGQATRICMDTSIDPDFALALIAARTAGVAVYGYSCPLNADGITLGEEIPVDVQPIT